MNLEQIRPVVDAVLYEGYILYPYRPTSAKNHQRWTFGGLYPRPYCEATGGAEPCHMQTQCLVEGDGATRLEVRARFLHPVAREVGELGQPRYTWPGGHEPDFRLVSSLSVGDKQFHTWQEAVEREVAAADCRLGELLEQDKSLDFAFDGRRELEPIKDGHGAIRGVLLRTQTRVRGRIKLSIEPVTETVYRLSARIENDTAMDPATVADHEQASLYAFASTHSVLGVEDGAFVSLMDPPLGLAEAAAACDNQGAYPVLAGEPGARDTLLSSPIILYDYPEVAPESPGDLFDATEIDEILSLNILAMTDEEKREMTATDPRAAALLARTESLSGDDFMRLHGVLRQPRPTDTLSPGGRVVQRAGDSASPQPQSGPPAAEEIPLEPASEPGPAGPRLAYYSNGGDRQLKVGGRVRLRPKAGGDAMDMILDGKTAVVEAIERDFEDKVHVAVAIDDDPGREWGLQRMPGHRFFFSADEVEPLGASPGREAAS